MATFTLYLPDTLLPLLDGARGNVSRSGWIRLAVENQLAGVPEGERSLALKDNPHLSPAMRADAERRLSKSPLQRPIVQKRS